MAEHFGEIQLGAVDLAVHTVILGDQGMHLAHDADVRAVHAELGAAAGMVAGVVLLGGVLHLL